MSTATRPLNGSFQALLKLDGAIACTERSRPKPVQKGPPGADAAAGRSLGMTSVVFFLYALAHLALFCWALLLLLRNRHPATVPLLIVTFGLIYDNAVLAVGGTIGHGELLERLSVPRFFMHAFATPLLMLSALGLMIRTRAQWTRRIPVVLSITALTIAMIAVGVEADLLGLDLQPKRAADLVSYGNAASAGPPVAPIVTIIVLIAAGLIVWRDGGPWLFLGATAQLAAAAIGDAITVAGNLGELALLAGLIATDHRLAQSNHAVRNGPAPS